MKRLVRVIHHPKRERTSTCLYGAKAWDQYVYGDDGDKAEETIGNGVKGCEEGAKLLRAAGYRAKAFPYEEIAMREHKPSMVIDIEGAYCHDLKEGE
jgi:hypothetical protein